jgi:GNAT superfamily N-acetyltransferase
MIRLAEAKDIPRLITIRAAVRENRLSNPGSVTAPDYGWYLANGCCWVWEDEEIAGFAALDAGNESIWALFVDPKLEGRGIGRALLGGLLSHAERLGLRRLTLSTAGGSRAEEFYRRAGWRVLRASTAGDIEMELIL